MAEASGSLKSKFCSSIPRPPCQSSRQLKPSLSRLPRISLSLSFQTRPPGPGARPASPHPAAGQVHPRQAACLLQQRQLQLLQVLSNINEKCWIGTKPSVVNTFTTLSRFDSGFRDSGQLEQEPHLEKAINSVRFVAQHVKNQDRYNKVGREKYLIYFSGPGCSRLSGSVKLCMLEILNHI